MFQGQPWGAVTRNAAGSTAACTLRALHIGFYTCESLLQNSVGNVLLVLKWLEDYSIIDLLSSMMLIMSSLSLLPTQAWHQIGSSPTVRIFGLHSKRICFCDRTSYFTSFHSSVLLVLIIYFYFIMFHFYFIILFLFYNVLLQVTLSSPASDLLWNSVENHSEYL